MVEKFFYSFFHFVVFFPFERILNFGLLLTDFFPLSFCLIRIISVLLFLSFEWGSHLALFGVLINFVTFSNEGSFALNFSVETEKKDLKTGLSARGFQNVILLH